MENLTERFIKDLYDFLSDGLSDATEEQAKYCFIDYLAVTCSGCAINAQKVKPYLQANSGNYSIYGLKDTTDLHTAVLVNAFHSHILELDDGNRVAMTHLGAPIFSTLLAVAEKENLGLKDIFYGPVFAIHQRNRIAGP